MRQAFAVNPRTFGWLFALCAGAIVVVLAIFYVPIAPCPGSDYAYPLTYSDVVRERHLVLKCPECKGRGTVTLPTQWALLSKSSFPHDEKYLEQFQRNISPEEKLKFDSLRSSSNPQDHEHAVEMILFMLATEELDSIGIRVSGWGNGKYWVVAESLQNKQSWEAIEAALSRAGIADYFGYSSLGETGWVVLKENFFEARRALIQDAKCQELGVIVSKPRFALKKK